MLSRYTSLLLHTPNLLVAGIVGALALAPVNTAMAATITFSTFIQTSDINAVEGTTSVIGITYAGNKFVGSLYPNNPNLYQSNLNGGNVTAFGSLPSAGGETVVAASLGLGGFNSGDIYAGSGGSGTIYHFSNAGGVPTLFSTVASGNIRQIFFDPGNSFGGNMIVTTDNGSIYTVNSSGHATLLASLGADTEGVDITPTSWGIYGGQLLVASEALNTVKLVSNIGIVTPTGLSIGSAESVSTVPTAFLGNPLEGFYVANYPQNIVRASNVSQFSGLGDHVLVSSENSPNLFDVFYNTGTNTFSATPITLNGTSISQFEDGIFVNAQRINDVSPSPEPASLTLLSIGIAGMVAYRWRKGKQAAA